MNSSKNEFCAVFASMILKRQSTFICISVKKCFPYFPMEPKFKRFQGITLDSKCATTIFKNNHVYTNSKQFSNKNKKRDSILT